MVATWADRSPGVYREDKFLKPEPRLPTGVAGFVGFATPRRPVAAYAPIALHHQEDFALCFEADKKSYLAEAVSGFFVNGGVRCYVAYTAPAQSPTEKRETPLQKAVESLAPLDDLDVIAVPDAATLAPEAMAKLQGWLLTHCAEQGDRFAVLDVPRDVSALIAGNHRAAILTAEVRPAAMSGALYYPWVWVKDSSSDGYDLRLMLVNTTDGLVNEGRGLVVVALVGTALHVRIFDANGRRIVDKVENELTSGETLTALKRQLNPFPDESALSQEQKRRLIKDATSIAGHTPSDKLVPPCGHIAGIFARSDARVGVFKAPANEEVLGAIDLEIGVSADMQEQLNPQGINCLRIFPGRGIRVWGARTLSEDPGWRYINVRRLFITVRRWIDAGMGWTVFEPNTPRLRTRIERELGGYLHGLWRLGALQGRTAEQAFYVKCDAETNPPGAPAEQLVTEIGLAPIAPAEFVVVRIVHRTPLTMSIGSE